MFLFIYVYICLSNVRTVRQMRLSYFPYTRTPCMSVAAPQSWQQILGFDRKLYIIVFDCLTVKSLSAFIFVEYRMVAIYSVSEFLSSFAVPPSATLPWHWRVSRKRRRLRVVSLSLLFANYPSPYRAL